MSERDADVVFYDLGKLEMALAQRDALVKALTEIAKGEGRFSRDPLIHASNTIEDMKKLALDALALLGRQP